MRAPTLFEKWQCMGLTGLPLGEPEAPAPQPVSETPVIPPVDRPRCAGCHRPLEYCICDGTGREPGDPGFDPAKRAALGRQSKPHPAGPAVLRWRDVSTGRAKLLDALEQHLRTAGWPYVAVDEAKRAMLGGAKVKPFDYLVYSSTGPNLLVLLVTRKPTPDQVQQMREWETVFGGNDFFAAFTFQAGGQWRILSLADLQTPDPMQRSRGLEECI